jgi:hypothetical protein
MPTKKTPEKELEILLPDNEFESSVLGKIKLICFPFGVWRKAIAIYNRRAAIFAGGEASAMTILAEDGEALEDLAELCLMACPELTREQMDTLPGDEAIALFFAVFAVNANFFIRATTQGASTVGKILGGAGEKSSKTLSDTDTDGTKS